MHVYKISCQLRQQALHVGPWAVPGNQAMNCKRRAKVMKAWLEAPSIVALHAGKATKSAEDSVCDSPCHPVSATGDEECRIRLDGMVLPSLACIADEQVDKIRTERHEPCLVELAFTNLDHSSGETYIVQGKGECLADTQPGSIQQEEKSAVRVCPNSAARALARGCGLEQTA